jgi:hypothetical protein
MLYAGLDLSRKRLDFHLLDADGATLEVGAAPPDGDGLGGLTQRLARHGEPIRAAIESMNGARFESVRGLLKRPAKRGLFLVHEPNDLAANAGVVACARNLRYLSSGSCR